jgi:signal transduction histidine kinase
MEAVLHLLICSTYQREFETIIQAEAWKNIHLHTFPQACIHPKLRKRAAEKIRQTWGQCNDQTLLVCECFALPKTEELGLKSFQVHHLDQCFYLLLNPLLVDHYMEQGAYLLAPGWLVGWRTHLERWGFDQDTGRKFFHETTQKLVLLDTRVNPRSQALLQEMGAYLDLPVESIPIGTDYLHQYLARIVADWQHENNVQQTQAIIAEINRKSADYAMAFDLLTKLTQIQNEAEAIETILDLFTMLFSPGAISYCPIVENEFGVGTECQQDEEGRVLLQHWALEKSEDYKWTASGTGFFLRFHFRSDTLGVLRVDDIKLVQYKQQYLNLALSIAHLCGLTISNARTFQRLQEAHDLLEQRVAERTVELQTANLGLERAGRMKDEFLASMSHELRTPLNSILGLSEALQLPQVDPLTEQQSTALAHIHNSGQRLLKLLNDILDFSKLGAGKFDLKLMPCSLAEICQASLQMNSARAAAQHLQSSFSMDPQLITLNADARILKQILANLLSNAIKFTPDGGSFGIDVLGSPETGEVRITVWDTGIGIQEADLSRLFQPFVQLDASLARQYNGAGLGLALVRKLTELHSGSISVQSTPGQGSRFTVSLPWRPA